MDRNLALLLRSKPQPKPQSNVIIKLKLEVEHNDPVEIEEGEIVEEKEGPARVLIKDGRKTSTVNRDRILKRLKGIVQEEEEEKNKEKDEEKGEEKDQDEDEEDKEEKLAKPAVKNKGTTVTIKNPKKLKLVVSEEPLQKQSQAINYNQKIGERTFKELLPEQTEKYIHRASSYYMNNRKLSVEKIANLFKPYRKEVLDTAETMTCNNKSGVSFDLLTHQKVVRDYLNILTPYRGLLLLHALGSGKTCTSIAIAEGMKTDKKIFIMTPASLKMNFFSELKRCGDHIYRKNQFWQFVNTTGQPGLEKDVSNALSGLPMEYIKKHGGAWFVDVQKPPNFTELPSSDQTAIDEQLNAMIRAKYKDINYNGLNMNKIKELTSNMTKNPFDNAVVLIDEAHNFVSRIVNKIDKPSSIPYILYENLLKANNAKIVLLTGTPVINYPNEIGILYNILRGYINTWTFQVNKVEGEKKISTETFLKIFDKANFKLYDYVDYSGKKLTITRNPFGFVNVDRKVGDEKNYVGVKLSDSGNISDGEFSQRVIKILAENGVEIAVGATQLTHHKALPDVSDDFLNMFVDEDSATIKNSQLFKRRILGLTSYLPSTQDKLLPSIIKTASGSNYHIVKSEMSDYQFSVYEKIRKEESDAEIKKNKQKRMKGNDDMFQVSSSYRIFSRAACNFAFPDPPGRPRPVPGRKEGEGEGEGEEGKDVSEAQLDAVPTELLQEVDEFAGQDDVAPETSGDYGEKIRLALKFIEDRPSEYLTESALKTYSPKFVDVLKNLTDASNIGLHLLYSQFRTIEGIGVLKLILEANGFAQFKIKKSGEVWDIDQNEDDAPKPKFLLYTGTESAEEKEILRNIYNSQWEFVPASITNKLEAVSPNNFMGDIVKIMMITSSGAEGINLRNTRFVHIVEPYWHMVRIDQVIGRARRICSHQDLPEELRTVKVFLYMSTLTNEQKTSEKHIELRIRDVSKIDKKTPITMDESLYDIALVKNNINQQLMKSVKESAFDCGLYKKEDLTCFGYGKIKSNDFGSYPSLEQDEQYKEELETKKTVIKVSEVTIGGVKYAYNESTKLVYNLEDYERTKMTGEDMVPVGKIVVQGKKQTFVAAGK
jgi:hypothetical protein